MTSKPNAPSHSAEAVPGPGVFRFLELPTEIRFTIYELVLDSACMCRKWKRSGSAMIDIQAKRLRKIRKLLQISQKIRSEYAHVLVYRRVVEFYIPPGVKCATPETSSPVPDSKGHSPGFDKALPTSEGPSVFTDITFSPSSFSQAKTFLNSLDSRDLNQFLRVPIKFCLFNCDRPVRPVGFGTALIETIPNVRSFALLMEISLPAKGRSLSDLRACPKLYDWALKFAQLWAETIVGELNRSCEDQFAWCAGGHTYYDEKSGIGGMIQYRKTSKPLAKIMGVKIEKRF